MNETPEKPVLQRLYPNLERERLSPEAQHPDWAETLESERPQQLNEELQKMFFNAGRFAAGATDEVAQKANDALNAFWAS